MTRTTYLTLAKVSGVYVAALTARWHKVPLATVQLWTHQLTH